MPDILKQNDNKQQASPQNGADKSANSKYFMSMQMTPNPLIKNSFASPVKDSTPEMIDNIQAYQDSSAIKQSAANKQFATMSSKKKHIRGARDSS